MSHETTSDGRSSPRSEPGSPASGPPLRPAAAQAKALTVAYMPHPIHLNQLDVMARGRRELKVDIDAPAIAYVDYVQAMTAQFLGPRNRYQVIWNNDDWGQLFGRSSSPSTT